MAEKIITNKNTTKTLGTDQSWHKDSFGQLGSVIVGAQTWTNRLLRSTKIVTQHIAKNDVFSYKCQLNHDKELGTNLDGFHIHMIPIGAVTGGEIIALDYAWGWLTSGDIFPDTLPNTGTGFITLEAGDQFKYRIRQVVTVDLIPPVGEGYSSEFFIECTRRNDAQDTYAGEFALLDGDVHYKSARFGSIYELGDTP